MDKSERRKFNIDQIPGLLNKRIFIGGNYDFMAKLRFIQKFVSKTGFTPILAYDFNVPKHKIRDYDLLLLHNCKYAIFDVTYPAGEMIELDRAIRDYNTIVFIVYEVRDIGRREPPAQVSSMITSLNIPMFGYATYEELENFISLIFPKIEVDIDSIWSDLKKIMWHPNKSKTLKYFPRYIRKARMPNREKLEEFLQSLEKPVDFKVAKNFVPGNRDIWYIPIIGEPRIIKLTITKTITHPSRKSYAGFRAVQVTVRVQCPKCKGRSYINHTFRVGRRDKQSGIEQVKCPDKHLFVLFKNLVQIREHIII